MRLGDTVRGGQLAPALPVPYPALTAGGLRIRRGQLSLTASAPSVGKSQLWQNLAHRMKVRTLYWSADTDQHDVTLRALALWTGYPVMDIERNLEEKAWRDYYYSRLDTNHIEWVFEPTITGTGLRQRIDAYAESHGDWPELVVLDNLSNTVVDEEKSASEQRSVMVAMQRLARESGAHIAVLTHAVGEYESGNRPIPQGGIANKLAKLPEVVLTLHRSSDDGKRVGVNVVKNRSGGPSDPGAFHPITLNVDYSRATVLGFEAVGE